MPDFSTIAAVFLPRLVALLALIVVTVASGIISSIVQKTFEWRRVGDFLGSMVLPKVGGWILVELLAFFTSPKVIPVEVGITHDILQGLGWAAYSAGFGSLVAQFLSNLYEMGVLENYTKNFSRKPPTGT